MEQSQLQYGYQNDSGYWVSAKAGLNKELIEELLENNTQTVPEIMEFSAKKYKDNPCMATRKLVKRHFVENHKVKLEQGDYIWSSYQEVQNQVLQVTQGLKNLGIVPGDKMAILSETRADWYIGALGAMRCGVTLVTLYTNLSVPELVHALVETEVGTVFVSYDLLHRLSKTLSDCKEIKRLIVFEDQLQEGRRPQNFPENVEIIGFKELHLFGELSIITVPSVAKSKDIAIIMYTSGSTGNPKGVELTHENLVSAAKGFITRVNSTQNSRYLTFLPLAHVLEFSTETCFFALGIGILYSSNHTLTNNSPKVLQGTLGDAQVACPTVMVTVPLVLDRIIKGITLGIEKWGKVAEYLFLNALKYKLNNPHSFATKILNFIIFNKIKAELGGQLQSLIVGGSPLSSQTHTLIRTIFDCTLQVGYGSTETSAIVSGMMPCDARPGTVGPITPNVFVYLESWEEGGYRITDKPRPRGEIIAGGPVVAKGYFKLPEDTSDAFFEKNDIRWYRTGDIGEFDDTGCLCIIDRKKDLIKLKNGQFVALGCIETALKTNKLIENICICADSYEDFTIAIVVPDSEEMKNFISAVLGSETSTNIEELYKNPRVVNAVKEELNKHGIQQGQSKKVLPASVILVTDHWLPENELVTVAQKLKRQNIKKKYNVEIRDAYAKLNKLSLKAIHYCSGLKI